MSRINFDIAEANKLADEYGKRLGVRVEYRFHPDQVYPSLNDGEARLVDEFGVRFYRPDGLNHGVRFKADELKLESVFAEAADAFLDRNSDWMAA